MKRRRITNTAGCTASASSTLLLIVLTVVASTMMQSIPTVGSVPRRTPTAVAAPSLPTRRRAQKGPAEASEEVIPITAVGTETEFFGSIIDTQAAAAEEGLEVIEETAVATQPETAVEPVPLAPEPQPDTLPATDATDPGPEKKKTSKITTTLEGSTSTVAASTEETVDPVAADASLSPVTEATVPETATTGTTANTEEAAPKEQGGPETPAEIGTGNDAVTEAAETVESPPAKTNVGEELGSESGASDASEQEAIVTTVIDSAYDRASHKGSKGPKGSKGSGKGSASGTLSVAPREDLVFLSSCDTTSDGRTYCTYKKYLDRTSGGSVIITEDSNSVAGGTGAEETEVGVNTTEAPATGAAEITTEASGPGASQQATSAATEKSNEEATDVSEVSEVPGIGPVAAAAAGDGSAGTTVAADPGSESAAKKKGKKRRRTTVRNLWSNIQEVLEKKGHEPIQAKSVTEIIEGAESSPKSKKGKKGKSGSGKAATLNGSSKSKGKGKKGSKSKQDYGNPVMATSGTPKKSSKDGKSAGATVVEVTTSGGPAKKGSKGGAPKSNGASKEGVKTAAEITTGNVEAKKASKGKDGSGGANTVAATSTTKASKGKDIGGGAGIADNTGGASPSKKGSKGKDGSGGGGADITGGAMSSKKGSKGKNGGGGAGIADTAGGGSSSKKGSKGKNGGGREESTGGATSTKKGSKGKNGSGEASIGKSGGGKGSKGSKGGSSNGRGGESSNGSCSASAGSEQFTDDVGTYVIVTQECVQAEGYYCPKLTWGIATGSGVNSGDTTVKYDYEMCLSNASESLDGEISDVENALKAALKERVNSCYGDTQSFATGQKGNKGKKSKKGGKRKLQTQEECGFAFVDSEPDDSVDSNGRCSQTQTCGGDCKVIDASLTVVYSCVGKDESDVQAEIRRFTKEWMEGGEYAQDDEEVEELNLILGTAPGTGGTGATIAAASGQEYVAPATGLSAAGIALVTLLALGLAILALMALRKKKSVYKTEMIELDEENLDKDLYDDGRTEVASSNAFSPRGDAAEFLNDGMLNDLDDEEYGRYRSDVHKCSSATCTQCSKQQSPTFLSTQQNDVPNRGSEDTVIL